MLLTELSHPVLRKKNHAIRKQRSEPCILPRSKNYYFSGNLSLQYLLSISNQPSQCQMSKLLCLLFKDNIWYHKYAVNNCYVRGHIFSSLINIICISICKNIGHPIMCKKLGDIYTNIVLEQGLKSMVDPLIGDV